MATRKQRNQRLTATVEELVAAAAAHPDDYKPADIIRDLEQYVRDEVEYNIYSFNANIYLLRLYQDNLEEMKSEMVAFILIKGLMALPANHFSQYLCLIPQGMQNQDQMKALIELHGLLENHNFPKVRDEVVSIRYRYMLNYIAGFPQAIEAYAIHVLSMTYEKVPRHPNLSTALGIFGRPLDKFIEYHVARSGWVVEKDENGKQLIIIPRTEVNHP